MTLEVRNVEDPRELLGWLPAPTGAQPGMTRTFPLKPLSTEEALAAAEVAAFLALPIRSMKDSSQAPGNQHWIGYATTSSLDTLKRIEDFVPAEGFRYE
jgi:hypothetical protein